MGVNVGVNVDAKPTEPGVNAVDYGIDYENVIARVQAALRNPKNIHRKVFAMALINLCNEWPNTNVVPVKVTGRRKRKRKQGHQLVFKFEKRTGVRTGNRLHLYVPRALQYPPEGHPLWHLHKKKRDIYFSQVENNLSDMQFVQFAIERVQSETRHMDVNEVRDYIWKDWLDPRDECPLCERIRSAYNAESHC